MWLMNPTLSKTQEEIKSQPTNKNLSANSLTTKPNPLHKLIQDLLLTLETQEVPTAFLTKPILSNLSERSFKRTSITASCLQSWQLQLWMKELECQVPMLSTELNTIKTT